MAKNIRDEIVAKRQARIDDLGHAEGVELPRSREVPIVPFLGEDGLICEVKRRSPSRGDIALGLDAVEQAGVYIKAGARNLSVLTEPEAFGGSLTDLVRVKRAYPRAAVIRKDFLFDAKDIDVSWRAGADAVLLIAGMLSADRLRMLYRCAKSLGLEALVEIHDDGDLAKTADLAPDLVGINSRDLATFAIDSLLPAKVKSGIGWDAKIVYESGIFHPEQAAFAVASGFSGILVGEGVVRDPALAGRLRDAMAGAKPCRFWPEIGRRLHAGSGWPLIKICGLARENDARLAADLGADVLGFVFWEGSPRRAGVDMVRAIRDVKTLKVGVAVTPAGGTALPPDLQVLLEEGLLDAVQFHGEEQPESCAALWPVYYKALRPGSPAEIAAADAYRCPRLLLDAAAPVPGGSGKRVGPEILEAWNRPLWLAGGITPENAGRIAEARRPELLDVASGVEEKPGEKSPDKLRRLFETLRRS